MEATYPNLLLTANTTNQLVILTILLFTLFILMPVSFCIR
jgi:hypothetical protein